MHIAGQLLELRRRAIGTGSPRVLRRGDRGGGSVRKVFSTDEAGRTTEATEQNANCASREAL
jgi:hypothetical protein